MDTVNNKEGSKLTTLETVHWRKTNLRNTNKDNTDFAVNVQT